MALNLKSERQVQTEIIARLIAQLGLTDVNPGSVMDVLTQSVAQQHFSLYYQIAQVSRLVDIDAMTGQDLDNKGFEYGLSRKAAEKTKGKITILRPVGFTKVSTTFYAGSPAPIAGDLTIDVNNASSNLIGSSGTLILGRGTNNEEEVSYVLSPTNQATFWRFQLVSALAKDHAVEETVILKQGNNEVILAGTTVIVPATGSNAEVRFSIDNDTILLAGEDSVINVEVTAAVTGSGSNIPVGAIDGEAAFPSAPFAGARARNAIKFTTGRDLQTDDDFRDSIKKYVQGLSKAVKEAILNAIVGLVDPETAKRVVSASIVLPVDVAGDVKIYIDDGTGFEPSFSSVGFETVLTQSTGGEERLQIDRFPIVKAQIETNAQEPFNMSSGPLALSFEVGNLSQTVMFYPADFRFPEIATAEEIVAIINDRSTLVEARTSQVGKYVLISAKVDKNEAIRVTGGAANAQLNFPTDEKSTINLYVDDVKLSKDGETATLDSRNSSPYNLNTVGPFPHTLTLLVDGKTANQQTATINLADVVNPAAVTVAEMVAVLNRDLVGIKASAIENNTKVRIESLTKLDDASKLQVTGGSMNNSLNGLNFQTTETSGVDGDYIFNRELGIIEFKSPLKANQSVTVGSQFTRAKFIAANAELYAPAAGETLVIQIDGGIDQTITFDGTFVAGKTAQQTADYINAILNGGRASVRKIGGLNYLQISTNTYATTGSLKIKNTSTANASFSFQLDTLAQSTAPNKAFLLSSASGPYNFAENDSLVLVINNDIINSTYSVPMNYGETISNAGSAQAFRAQPLTSIFPLADQIVDYYLAFKSGPNTGSSTIENVTINGSTARYSYGTAPTNMNIFSVGDLFKAEGMSNSENNGNFVISGIGSNYVEVQNADAIATTGQTGTGTLSQRRQISAYNNQNGLITMTAGFAVAPSVGDDFVVIPSTVANVVDYMNSTKITSLSLKANIEAALNNTRVQISSKLEGSDGYVQVTGGNANKRFGFSTVLTRGLAAYSYWTGLLALVHKTIYGDDSDLASYPGIGAAGITFRVLAPTVRQIGMELDVALAEGVSISSLENDIKSAVTGYINTLGVGQDVIIERIRAAVIAIPGITDVVVTSHTANIPIADNEKAAISDPDVLIG